MENNIKVFRAHRALSWFYGLLGILTLFACVVMLNDVESFGTMIGIFVLFALFFSVHHFIAKGAKKKKAWAKAGSVIIAIFLLLGFPLGTIIGIYLLINNSGWDTP